MSSPETVFRANLSRLQEALAEFLRGRRWFGGKAQPIRSLEILDVLPFDAAATATFFLLVHIAYDEGHSDTYSIPVTQTADAASIPSGADGNPRTAVTGGLLRGFSDGVLQCKTRWRRERDSNPRYGFPYSGFQDRLFQPLTHPSA